MHNKPRRPGFFNLLGHNFKIVSFYLIYAAIIKTNLKKPYESLAIEIDERKITEAKLLAAEEKYRRLAENARGMIFRMSFPDGVYEYVSSSATDIFGCLPEEFYNKPLLIRDVIHPDWRGYFVEQWENLVKGEMLSVYEYQILHKSGATKLLNQWNVLVKDTNGKPIAIEGIVTDITERKRSETALRESKSLLQAILESTADGLLAINQDNKVLFANERFAEMWMIQPKVVAGRDYAVLLQYVLDQLIDPQSFLQKVQELCKSKEEDYDTLYFKDGRVFERLSRPLLKGAELWGRVFSFRDITERKRMEETLRQAEENFRRSLDESPLGVRIVTIDGKILYANRAILDIYGYDSLDELRATPVKKRYTPESFAEFQIRREKRQRGDYGPAEYEISIVRKDGEVRRLQVFRRAVLWDGKEQFQVIYNDITERGQAEEQLQHTLDSLRKAFSTTIQIMVSAVETRDPYTAGHQIRSADLARAIATEMGLPKDKIDAIRMAGSIHDIGKLSIPAEILSKPTKLSEIKFSLIKEHAMQGYEILKDVESPWNLAEIVYQHHERMDGSGYPRGLKGEEILIEARILAVSDVVESMASNRPYRPALGLDAALEESKRTRDPFMTRLPLNPV